MVVAYSGLEIPGLKELQQHARESLSVDVSIVKYLDRPVYIRRRSPIATHIWITGRPRFFQSTNVKISR
jgi:hypothetical protein